MKNREISVSTPGFGPKKGPNDSKHLADGYFFNTNTCMTQKEYLFIIIVTVQNLYGPFSNEKHLSWSINPRFGPNCPQNVTKRDQSVTK